MNSKDYNEIAGIIKDHNNQDGFGGDCIDTKIFTKALADYFEREDKEQAKGVYMFEKFNRQQFLKDCGVEK